MKYVTISFPHLYIGKMKKFVVEHEVRDQWIDNECDNNTNYFQLTNIKREIIDLRKKLKDISNKNTISCSFEIMRVKNNDFYQRFVCYVFNNT